MQKCCSAVWFVLRLWFIFDMFTEERAMRNHDQSCTSDASILCFSPFTQASSAERTSPDHHIIMCIKTCVIRERHKPPRHSAVGSLITSSISSDARESVKKIRRLQLFVPHCCKAPEDEQWSKDTSRKAFNADSFTSQYDTDIHQLWTKTRSHDEL